MGITLADTIREITRKHLEKGGLLLGQSITAVGWVNQTVPDCQGIIELPMADVAGSGIAVGTALVGRRPILVIRFQDFFPLHSSPILNYAAKSKDIFGIGVPIFIRAIADEGRGMGPCHSACLHAIPMHFPGMRVCAPVTPREYEEVWKVFMANDEPMFVSEHRGAFAQKEELDSLIARDADITIFAISMARFSALRAVEMLKQDGIKCNLVHILWLKPYEPLCKFSMPLRKSGRGLVVDSGFEITGASQSIAYRLMLATGKPVKALGAEDRSVGASERFENTTPTPERIADECRLIIGKS